MAVNSEMAPSFIVDLSQDELMRTRSDNHDVEIYTVSAVFSVLAIVTVVARVMSRHLKSSAVGVEDALVIAALVCLHSPHPSTRIFMFVQRVANRNHR